MRLERGSVARVEGEDREKVPPLGNLERAVLTRLWSHGPADPRRMHAAVGAPRGITVNTVQSTLERLCRKRLAARSKRGRSYCYAARVSREEWVARCLEELLCGLPGTEPRAYLATFVSLAERAGPGHLEELERLVRARREHQGEEGA